MRMTDDTLPSSQGEQAFHGFLLLFCFFFWSVVNSTTQYKQWPEDLSTIICILAQPQRAEKRKESSQGEGGGELPVSSYHSREETHAHCSLRVPPRDVQDSREVVLQIAQFYQLRNCNCVLYMSPLLLLTLFLLREIGRNNNTCLVRQYYRTGKCTASS